MIGIGNEESGQTRLDWPDNNLDILVVDNLKFNFILKSKLDPYIFFTFK